MGGVLRQLAAVASKQLRHPLSLSSLYSLTLACSPVFVVPKHNRDRYEGKLGFFYPVRLMIAFALCLLVQFLGLLFITLGMRYLQYLLEHGSDLLVEQQVFDPPLSLLFVLVLLIFSGCGAEKSCGKRHWRLQSTCPRYVALEKGERERESWKDS